MIVGREQYRAYLASPAWQVKRRNKINRDGDWVIRDLGVLRGECCQASVHVDDVEIHHRTYQRIGNEAYGDLMIVCSRCHQRLDEERKHRA